MCYAYVMTTTPRPQFDAGYLGSVSHGTMREQDLIPTFIGLIGDLEPEEAQDLESAWLAMLDEDGDLAEDSFEEAGWLLERLFDILDEMAPDGASFGAHEGDGADYGFWLHDEGEDDENYFDAPDEDPAVPENPYAGPGGLLDEVRQAERIAGTE